MYLLTKQPPSNLALKLKGIENTGVKCAFHFAISMDPSILYKKTIFYIVPGCVAGTKNSSEI